VEVVAVAGRPGAGDGPDPDGFMDFFARELKPALGG